MSVQTTFDKFDKNRSGFLDYGALQNAMTHYGLDMSTGQARSVLKAYDDKPDGRMDLDEFSKLVKDIETGATKLPSSSSGKKGGSDYDAANRKIALEVLQRRNPSASRSRYAPSVHRGGASAMSLNQREYEPGHPRNQRAYNYAGGTVGSGVRRLPIDGYLRAGSSEIEWKPPAASRPLSATFPTASPSPSLSSSSYHGHHPAFRPPLGSASGALPWWNNHTGNTSGAFNYGVPRPGLVNPITAAHGHAERTLAGRYHQIAVPPKLAKFRAALECTELDNDYHYDKREALWHSFDGNGTGYVSLAACNGGIMSALSSMWGKEGDELFRRYYRSYIRAWSDAKDAVAAVKGPRDDDYVTRSEFRLLLVYLCCYATWYEVFRYITDDSKDHRLSKDEWNRHLPKIVAAGNGWADSLALASATATSFEEMDQNDGGFVDLQEFCEWVEAAEKRAGTEQGLALGVNEPVDRPSHKTKKVPFAPELPEGAATEDVVPMQ